MKEKLFIMLLCFFFFNIHAEIKDTSIKSKLILDSKNYIGDELISKKEFAKKPNYSENLLDDEVKIYTEINN